MILFLCIWFALYFPLAFFVVAFMARRMGDD